MNNQNDDAQADTIYVLDTSSIRAIQFKDLQNAASRARVAVSPISVFEFLCHLDEKDKRKRGDTTTDMSQLHKVNLLKCKGLMLLDDPYAEQADAVGARDLVNPSRFEDKVVLPQLFPALESSSTLDAFYEQQVIYLTGEVANVRDSAARVSALLEEEEARYKAHVMEWCRLMLQNFGFERLQQFTPVEFVRFAVEAASGLASYYEEGLRATGAIDLKAPVFSAIYVSIGYGIARTIEYLRKANGLISSLNIDPNDMEDSAICLHLTLVEYRILVTGDKGTYDAVTRALQDLRSASLTLNQPVTVFADVIKTDEFERRLLPGIR